MEQSNILQYFQTAMQLVAVVSIPPLLVAMAIGLLIAILQAATQIQDQTLPLTVKVIAVGMTLAIFGGVLTQPLFQHARRIFEEFPSLTR